MVATADGAPRAGADLPIARPFAFYALVRDGVASGSAAWRGGGEYTQHVLPLGTCTSFGEFASYVHHIPDPGAIFTGRHAWRIAKRYWGYGMCFFEEAVRPEWEDPANRDGIDLVCRQALDPATLTRAWHALLLLLVNGEAEDATGVRVSHRRGGRNCSSGVQHKLEVWTRRAADATRLVLLLRERVGLEFAVVPRKL